MKVRRGQVAVYLVLVLVAITVLVLMNAGTFLAVRAKNHAMNAGDAAALAAAKVQAELLNEIGRLNLRHAEADLVGDYATSLEIVRQQKRLAFMGPLRCLKAADEAARANGAEPSSEMSGILMRHVSDIRTKYEANPELYPEPWEGAWEEYAGELAAVVSGGLAVGSDNIDFADAVSCFPLTSKSFYSMVEGESWCKLVVAGWTGLLDCDSHNMPRPQENENAVIVNCEVCSLHLALKPLEATTAADADAFRAVLARNGAEFAPEADWKEDGRPPDDPSRYYFFYDDPEEDGRAVWRPWVEMDPSSKFRFPILGRVRPEFDVMGCASVFRVEETVPRLLSDSSTRGNWSAAAKPFGTIETSSGRSIVTDPEARRMVLPAYEAVRLVPLSAAYVGGEDLSTADAEWLEHVREHVQRYLADGIGGLPVGCRYCRSLVKWEDAGFRSKIASWISEHGESCTRSNGPGTYEGGTSYAH